MESFSRYIHFCSSHYKMVSFFCVVLGSLIGFSSLFAYAQYIGQAGLFMTAISEGASLIGWLLLFIPVVIGILLCLIATMFFYVVSVMMFSYSRDQVAWRLLLLLSFGFLILVTLLFSGFSIYPVVKITIVIFSVVIGLCIVYCKMGLKQLVDQNGLESQRKIYFMISLFGVLVGSVLSSIFLLYIALNAYIGVDSEVEAWTVGLCLFFTLVFSLLPAFVFFIWNGGFKEKIISGGVFLFIFFVVYFVVADGAFSSVAYAVAGKLEVRQTYSMRFILSDEFEMRDFDRKEWKARLREGGKIEVEAFKLFSFGDVLLLCPTRVLGIDASKLRLHTQSCIHTQRDKVQSLPLIDKV